MGGHKYVLYILLYEVIQYSIAGNFNLGGPE